MKRIRKFMTAASVLTAMMAIALLVADVYHPGVATCVLEDGTKGANSTPQAVSKSKAGKAGASSSGKTTRTQKAAAKAKTDTKPDADKKQTAVTPEVEAVEVKGERKQSAAAGGGELAALNSRLLQDINELRASVGLSALTMDGDLLAIAAVRSGEASALWSHTRPDGTQGCDMISSNKWRGENLSYVKYAAFNGTDTEQVTAADYMFANLKASPTHYDNMVFGSFTRIGIHTTKTTDGSGVKLTTAYMFSN